MRLTLHFSHPISHSEEAEVRYCLHDMTPDTPPVAQGIASLAQLTELLAGLSTAHDAITEAVLVVPGESVTCRNVVLPKGSKRHLQQALPFLLEEELAAPVETLHIAHGTPDSNNRALVLVIDKTLMAGWVDFARSLALPLIALIPDYLMLPAADAPQIAHWHGKTLARLPGGSGMTFPTSVSLSPIEQLAAETVSGDVLDMQFLESKMPAGLNLLQGEFKPNTTASKNWRKPLAYSLAASLCLFLVYFAIAGLYFDRQAAALNREARTLYETLFPQDIRIVNIRRQMEGHLLVNNEEGGESAFFPLLLNLSVAITQTGEQDVQIRHLQFERKGGTLMTEVQATSMSVSHTLQQHLTDTGVKSDILSVSKNDQGVIARLKVGG